MPTDIERLVVQMSADFTAFRREMQKATSTSTTEFRNIKKAADTAGKGMEKSFSGFGRAAQQSSGNVVAFRTGIQQAAFQVQDFAVQVQGGTKATVALGQQLPQLLGAFGVLGSVIGAGVAVGLPLIVSAFRSLGDESVPLADRLTGLTDALNAVKDAAELQALSIDELTKRYGTADAAVQKLIASTAQLAIDQAMTSVRELSGAFSEFTDQSFFQTAADGLTEINEGIANIVRSFDLDLNQSSEAAIAQAERLQAAFRAFEEAATRGPEAAFQAAVDLTRELLNAGEAATGTAEEVNNISDTLGQLRGKTDEVASGVDAIRESTAAATAAAQGLAAAWGSVAQSSARAAQMAADAAAAAGNRAAPMGTFAIPPAGPGGGAGDFPLYNPPPKPADFPVYYPDATVSSRGGGGVGGGGGGGSSAASRESAEQVRAQQDAIADSVREVERAQADLERRNERVARSFSDLFTDAITGANSLQESVAGLAEEFGRLLLQRGFETLLNGTGAGGIAGQIFGGGRASGGPVSAGRPYIVGERGPEMFVPRMSGSIIPNHQMASASGGGGGGAAGRVILELSPDLEARVLTEAARNSVQIVSKSSREQAATFRDRTIGAVRDPRRRGS